MYYRAQFPERMRFDVSTDNSVANLGVLNYDLRELYKPLNPFEYFDLEGDNKNLPSQARYKALIRLLIGALSFCA